MLKSTVLPPQIRLGFILLALSLVMNALITCDNLQRALSRASPTGMWLNLEILSVILGFVINLVTLFILYQWATQQFKRRSEIEKSLRSHQAELSNHIERCTYELEERLQTQQSLSQSITLERQRLEQLKDEFIAIVGHELKTPVTSIHGSLKMLNSGLVDTGSEQGQRLLTIATASADRLTSLISQILALENATSGLVGNIVTCDVRKFLEESIELQRSFALEHGIGLGFTLVPESQLYVLADPQYFQQVIHHLIRNAIQFSPSDSMVTVKAVAKDEQVIFMVQDQGKGIAPAQLEVIFDRFHQLDYSFAKTHEGPGLGLAICRKMVEAMGGQIWAESQPGVGSIFYFTLPRSVA